MPVPRSIAGGARRRLLVVDDNQKQLDAVKRKFKAHVDRVEFITAANGIDALVAVGSFNPHLLVLDVYMPGEMDGLEVCRRLKDRASQLKATEILVTSGLLTSDVEAEAARRARRRPSASQSTSRSFSSTSASRSRRPNLRRVEILLGSSHQETCAGSALDAVVGAALPPSEVDLRPTGPGEALR